MARLTSFRAVCCLSLSLLLLWIFGGCTKSTTKTPPAANKPAASSPAGAHEHDHDHGDAKDAHDHGDADAHGAGELQTLAAGIAALEKHYQEIKDAFGSGDADKAHDPMHGVGNVLLAIPDLAKTAGLSAEDSAKLQQAVDKLTEAYGSLDDAVHEGKTPDYQAVAEQIDQQLAILRTWAKSP